MENNENQTEFLMGTLPEIYMKGRSKNITFIVTENCNLSCTYCYEKKRKKKNRMTYEVAQKAVDYILNNPKEFPQQAVVWEFTGGEPLLEIELIDKICDYIKLQMYQQKHKWLNNYMFNMATNGILYHLPKVQNYIKKNHSHLSIGISIDGNEKKHNISRIYPDGSGSYDDVVRNVKLWLEQFPNSSPKTTYGHDDLVYLKESIIHLWDMGFKSILGNVVFEDVWHDGDDEILEKQLKELADYIIKNSLWKDHSCSFFNERIGFPLLEDEKNSNYCGAGLMLAIDCQGNFYPCLRFAPFSLINKKSPIVGEVESGYNHDRLRPYLVLDTISQSSEECLTCDVAMGCAWCTGHNYDIADTDTVYQRATFICKMHKARVRANEYFWNQLTRKTGMFSTRREDCKIDRRPTLNILLTNQGVSWCHYRVAKMNEIFITKQSLEKAILFAEEYLYNLTFTIGSSPLPEEIRSIITNQRGSIIAPWYIVDDSQLFQNREIIFVADSKNLPSNKRFIDNMLLHIYRNELPALFNITKKVTSYCHRLNIILMNLENFNVKDLKEYEKQLASITNLFINPSNNFKIREINVITDRLSLNKMRNCNAGIEQVTLSPEGKFYLCPAFYYLDSEGSIGDLNNGLNIPNLRLMKLENSPICRECDAYQCHRCIYLNKLRTFEYNIPSYNQCVIANLEHNATADLVEKLDNLEKDEIKDLHKHDEIDPMVRLITKRGRLDIITTKGRE